MTLVGLWNTVAPDNDAQSPALDVTSDDLVRHPQPQLLSTPQNAETGGMERTVHVTPLPAGPSQAGMPKHSRRLTVSPLPPTLRKARSTTPAKRLRPADFAPAPAYDGLSKVRPREPLLETPALGPRALTATGRQTTCAPLHRLDAGSHRAGDHPAMGSGEGDPVAAAQEDVAVEVMSVVLRLTDQVERRAAREERDEAKANAHRKYRGLKAGGSVMSRARQRQVHRQRYESIRPLGVLEPQCLG